MAQLIFINLPVADLPRSIAFYEAVERYMNENRDLLLGDEDEAGYHKAGIGR